MKILKFCRHKKGIWEGVIFEDNTGTHYITNGIGLWEENERRLEGVDIVNSIDIAKLCSYMKQNHSQAKLLEQLLEHSAYGL